MAVIVEFLTSTKTITTFFETGILLFKLSEADPTTCNTIC